MVIGEGEVPKGTENMTEGKNIRWEEERVGQSHW